MTGTTAFAIFAICYGATVAAQPGVRGDAAAAVHALYHDFAADAVIDDEPPGDRSDLASAPRSTLLKYFDDSLTALVLNDRACVRQTHQICHLDFDPIWASQDPVGTIVKKISTTADPSKVLVDLRYFERPQLKRLTYRMVKTPAGWRVHDIEYEGHEYLAALLRKD